MGKIWKRILWVALALLLLWGLNYARKSLPIAHGYNAKMLCSCVFVGQRQDSACIKEDLAGYNLIKKEINWSEKSVYASFYGLFKRKAVYREGLGCTLESDPKEQPVIPVIKTSKAPVLSDTVLWPYGAQYQVYNNQVGVDYSKIKNALDFAFDEPFKDKKRGTRAVIIIRHDSVIAEQYAPGFTENTRFLGWSMTKSIVSSALGILAKDGLIQVTQNHLFPEWTDERKDITIDQLLRMSSGLYFEEEYTSSSLATQMLFNSFSVKRIPKQQKLKTKPYEEWYYSSGTTNLLTNILYHKTEPRTLDFVYNRLIYKIGMGSMVLEPDAAGMWVGSSFSYATARDWAKFGLLYLHDGVWNGERILADGWVNYTATPTPKSDSLMYGAHFWLNGAPDKSKPAVRWPELPNDIFYASGYQGQHVVIIPSYNMVIVRLGQYSDGTAWSLREFLNLTLSSIKK